MAATTALIHIPTTIPKTTNRLKNAMISNPEMEAKITLRSGVGQPCLGFKMTNWPPVPRDG